MAHAVPSRGPRRETHRNPLLRRQVGSTCPVAAALCVRGRLRNAPVTRIVCR